MARAPARRARRCPSLALPKKSSRRGVAMAIAYKRELQSRGSPRDPAHPDDESSKRRRTMRCTPDGVRVSLVCATGGEEGDILNPRMDRPGVKERIAELRREELEVACEILGVSEVYHLGYRDSGMPGTPANERPEAFWNADPEEAVGKLVEVIRKERPEVVLSYDESKGYEHPDHIRVYEWGRRAFEEAGDRRSNPMRVSRTPSTRYYSATFSKKRMSMLHEAALGEGVESPAGGRDRGCERFETRHTAHVDVGDYLELRSKALLATQRK